MSNTEDKKTPPKRKNVSQTIPNGRTLQTRDEYLGEENKDYRKPGYEGKGLYRKITVVDSNRKNELIVIKLTTSDKGIQIETYKNGKSKFRPYIIVEDDKGNPIKITPGKFVENPQSADVPQAEISKIKKIAFKKSKHASENRQKAREIKGRQKKGGK
ncbi:MAG: hypothetical protein HDQ88_10600 [Clostridia bacterium]|nr:hypothetical protein [Clostridia bacterium]